MPVHFFFFLVNLFTNSVACSSHKNSKCLLSLTLTIQAEIMSCLLHANETNMFSPKFHQFKQIYFLREKFKHKERGILVLYNRVFRIRGFQKWILSKTAFRLKSKLWMILSFAAHFSLLLTLLPNTGYSKLGHNVISLLILNTTFSSSPAISYKHLFKLSI